MNESWENMNELIIDCFAGGGGASVGIEIALGRCVDIAVNHDPQAILMHRTNHPDTLHLTEDMFTVDLQKYVGGRHVALMWASPDCTSHSRANGGRPRKQGLRILPWAVYKHARVILPDVVIMENVAEIQQWGPLDGDGCPIREKRGEEYRRFIRSMKALGYMFDSRELVAADYGAPTTRKRWYAVFRRDGRDIVWPEQTHSKGGAGGLKPWEPIYKYLDMKDFGKSIFGRKKPLAENTMKRIARGLEKFVFSCPEPFMVQVNHGGDNFRGQHMHEPLPTVTQKNGFGMVTPYMMQAGHCLASPFLIQYHSETTEKVVRGQQATEPVQTIDTSNRYGLSMSYITKFYKTGTGQSVTEPIHTITTSPGHFGTVSVAAVDWKELQAAGMDEETAQKCTWVSLFLMEYYGCSTEQELQEPLHTIVTRDRFALVTVLRDEYVILDIFLRMLTPEELKLGQGFPADYIIDRDYLWNTYPTAERVKRIGNSVVPVMAQKLVEANCSYLKTGERTKNLRVDESSPQLRFA